MCVRADCMASAWFNTHVVTGLIETPEYSHEEAGPNAIVHIVYAVYIYIEV